MMQPGVRASKFAADGKFIEYYFEDAKTTHAALVRGLRVSSMYLLTYLLTYLYCYYNLTWNFWTKFFMDRVVHNYVWDENKD